MILFAREKTCKIQKLSGVCVHNRHKINKKSSTLVKYFYNCAMKNKIAIVGAGPGGLTAAMILSKRGYEVDVYEKDGHV